MTDDFPHNPDFPDRRTQEPVAAAEAARRWISVIDRDGLRHTIRIASVIALSDVDETRDATAITLPGGRVIIVGEPLDALDHAVRSGACR